MSEDLRLLFAADALAKAADEIRDAQPVYDAVDVYFALRGIDADAEDVARALTDAVRQLRGGAL